MAVYTQTLINIDSASWKIDFIICMLNDNDTEIKKSAEMSLINITGENFGQNVVQWQNWWDKNKIKFSKERTRRRAEQRMKSDR
ncbi:hypothetical protein BMS3Abin06_02500 [bacterium BMS3Abin06]|nr:hypothetical protein BMS3Abin06_02500 [bacterium BMS3Abin06]